MFCIKRIETLSMVIALYCKVAIRVKVLPIRPATHAKDVQSERVICRERELELSVMFDILN